MAVAAALALGGQAAAEAAPAKPAALRLASYDLSVSGPTASGPACGDYFPECGTVHLSVILGGLNRVPGRPTGDFGPPEANLTGAARVTRNYGCQDATGKRLRSYDRTVTETVTLDTRWSFGFTFPRTGDTAPVDVYAFLADRHPGNCPSGATATTYRITAGLTGPLELTSYVDTIASRTYCAHDHARWTGAFQAPASAEGRS